MISPGKITAGWLIDGLQSCHATQAPPTGLEFPGLLLEPGQDPIPQIGRLLAPAHLGLPMKRALQEAITDASLHRFEPEFANDVMLGLVRLLDYFGSPTANRLLLLKLERGDLDAATPYLLQRIATVGARQDPILRERFETGFKCPGIPARAPELALPFLRAELEESPETWLDTALSRSADLKDLEDEGINALALALGALCGDGREREVLTGLASGRSPEHEPILDLLFGDSHPEASLFIEPAIRASQSEVSLTLDLYDQRFPLGDLIELRPREDIVNEHSIRGEIEWIQARQAWQNELRRHGMGHHSRAAA